MGKKLYVGNLTNSVSSSNLQEWFTPFGTVQSAQVIQDRDKGRSKGFGFVEMDTDAQADTASRDSMTTSMTGVVSRCTKPSHG